MDKICKNCKSWKRFKTKNLTMWGTCGLLSFPHPHTDVDYDIECQCDYIESVGFECQDEFGCG